MTYPIDESHALVMAQSAPEYPRSEMTIACLNELIKAAVITVLFLAVPAALDENDFAGINGAEAWKICFDRPFWSLPLTWRFHNGASECNSWEPFSLKLALYVSRGSPCPAQNRDNSHSTR